MKDFLQNAAGLVALAGFLWQIVKGYEAIYDAIDKRTNIADKRINDIERQLAVHEIECSESLKRLEYMIVSLQVGLNPKTKN